MTEHPAAHELELYVMGSHEGLAVADLEAHLAECGDCSAVVRREARLELNLLDLAPRLRDCPSCRRAVATARCGSCGAALEAGGYRILDVVVQNAHGRLYLAEGADGRRVALKELAFVQAPGVEAIAAFEREAKFLRALEHAGIPRFVASFQEGEGVHTRLFLAQEYIEGESLQARLADHWFDEDEAVEVARRVLEILAYLQDLSPIVVHGDVKPANLVRRPDGGIALVDFGAARSFGGTVTSVVGTFGYMPIEQLAGTVNPTTDLYGLGASLLQLLSREEPWKVLEDPAALGRLNVSPELRRFLGKLAARRASDRFPSARAALEALARLRAPAPSRRWRWLPAAIAAGALLAGGMGYGIARLTMDRADPSPRPRLPKTSLGAPAPSGDFTALFIDDDKTWLAPYSAEDGVNRASAVRVATDITDAVQDPMTRRWYVLNEGVLGELEPFPDGFRSLEVPPAPTLLGPSAIAFDSSRRRLLVASATDGADNDYHLFAYEPDHRRWSTLVNLGALQLEALTYFPDDDQLYGISEAGLVFLLGAENGRAVGHHPLPQRFDASEAQLVAFGGEVLLVEDGRVEAIDEIEVDDEGESFGNISITSDVPCEILIDAEEIGESTPLHDYPVAPATHEVTLVNRERGVRRTFTINVEPDTSHVYDLSVAGARRFEAVLRGAKLAYTQRHFAKALVQAEEALELRAGDQESLSIAGMAACKLRNRDVAEKYLRRLRGDRLMLVRQICLVEKVDLPD